MKSIGVAVCALAALGVANSACAQCQRGGGGGTTASTGGAMVASSGVATGATLLQGPGSLAFQMRQAAATRQQLAQLQLMRAQQAAARRAESLAQRHYNAERTRTETAARRERMRAFIAAQNGQTRTDAQRQATANQVASR
jgi:hypothetical protein